jgi:hypothetical protein
MKLSLIQYLEENVLSHIQKERETKKVYRLNGFNGKQL